MTKRCFLPMVMSSRLFMSIPEPELSLYTWDGFGCERCVPPLSSYFSQLPMSSEAMLDSNCIFRCIAS